MVSIILTYYTIRKKNLDNLRLEFLDSKHVHKVNFKPSRKNKDFVFLPVPILLGWIDIFKTNVKETCNFMVV